MEEIDLQLEMAEEKMQHAIKHTKDTLGKIRAGKATPNLVENLQVMYYQNLTPMNQVAAVSVPDARTIVIKPWEKSTIPEIEKTILHSDLGLNPQNDGEIIRINVPPLTEERREMLVKKAKQEAENGKIIIRSVRKDVNDELKKLKNKGVSEDQIKDAEIEVQNITNKFSNKIDALFADKEKDIMTL